MMTVLQKMLDVGKALEDSLACCKSEMRTVYVHREKFINQMKEIITNNPQNYSGLNSILNPEIDRLSAFIPSSKTTLQVSKESNVLI